MNVFEGNAAFNVVDFAVSQKLLPKINSYSDSIPREGDDKTFKNWLDDLRGDFEKKGMNRCKKIIDRIIKCGKAMDYYKFF